MRRAPLVLAALAAAALTAGATAIAAPAAPPPACNLPARTVPAPPEPIPPGEVVRDVPTTYYLLALTWSPEWCRTRAGDPTQALQCRDNRFGFIVHGLWPNGEGDRQPRYCAPAPAIDAATMRRHLCMIPSPAQMQHEWAAHGVCAWPNPAAYLRQTEALWRTLTPPRLTRPVMTAGEVRAAFAQANPAVPHAALRIRATPDNRLYEVSVCYGVNFRPIACPSPGAPDAVRLQVTSQQGG